MFNTLIRLSECDWLAIIAILYLAYFGLHVVVMSFMNANINYKVLAVHLFLLAVAMGIIAFHMTYSDRGPDLERHWREWHIVNGDSGEGVKVARISAIAANGLFLWDGFLLLSTYLGDVHFLAGLVVFFTYIFFWKSCVLVCRHYNSSYREFALYLVLEFGLVSMYHMFAGLRNVFAFSAAGYALLLDCWHTKKSDYVKILFALLCAIFIHSAGFFCVLFFILHHLIKRKFIKKILYIGLCVWGYFSFILVNLFKYFPFPIFTYFGNKAVSYYGINTVLDMPGWQLISILVFYVVFGLQVYHVSINKKILISDINNEKTAYFDYILLMESFVLGSLLVPEIILRIMYLFGFTIYPFVLETDLKKNSRKYYFYILIEVALCVLMGFYGFWGIKSHMHLESIDYSFLDKWSLF